MIGVALLGLALVSSRFKATEQEVYEGMVEGMQDVVREGAEVVKRNASGRPGPNVITDTYRRSIRGVVTSEGPSGTGVGGIIHTNAVQALRLEFGFRGTDSIGRTYNQPPYPHFRPALPEVRALSVKHIGRGLSTKLKIG